MASDILRADLARKPLASWVAACILFGVVPQVSAQQQISNSCMQDVYNEFNGTQSLNCTANDVRIASVINIEVLDDGCAFLGDTVTFNATLEVELTASARHDVGIYIAEDGGDALSGSCLVTILPFQPADDSGSCVGAGDPFPCCTGAGTGSCGFTDLDGTADTGMACSGDNDRPCNVDADCSSVGAGTCVNLGPGIQDECGDIDAAPNPVYHNITNVTLACVDSDNNGLLDVGTCTSWRQPGSNELCLSPLFAFPGAPSKCLCEPKTSFPINIPKTIKVCKELLPADDSGVFNLQLDGTTEFADAGDGDCTAAVEVATGTHTVSETAGTGTSLADYNPMITCVDMAGRCTGDSSISCLVDATCVSQAAGTCDLTPTPVGSCMNCTSQDVTVGTMATQIVCTMTNTNVCYNVCGDGACDPACNEDCDTCPADCGCTPCSQICSAGTCVSNVRRRNV